MPENSVTLRNLRIFMDEAPELVPAQYPDVRAQIGQAEDDPTPWQAARAAIMPHHAKSQATGPCSELVAHAAWAAVSRITRLYP